MTGSNPAEAPRTAQLDGAAVAEARRLVRSRFVAWNRGDSEALRALLHVPHVSLPGPRLSIREREPDPVSSAHPRALASLHGWHHSSLDRLDVRGCSPDTVHCSMTFDKRAADGRRYADAEAVSIVTRRGGRWGIQLNSVTLRPIGVGGGDHAGAVERATALLRQWLAVCDGAEPLPVRQLVHLPFVELRGPRLVVHRTASALRRDVARIAATRPRHRRELRHVDVRERSARKVTLEVDIARLEPGGSLVGRDVALVIVTELQGRWALQVHSSC